MPFLIKLTNIRILLFKIEPETAAADTQTKARKKMVLRREKKQIKFNEHYNKMGRLIVNLLQKFHIQRIQNDRFISHNNRSFK